MYNFDFAGAGRILDGYIGANPGDPMGYTVRAASLLFSELDRLKILEAEFFADDERLVDKKKLRPDPAVKARFYEALAGARDRGERLLAGDPNHVDSLFALTLSYGLETDYIALVERKQWKSLSFAKRSNELALRLLRLDPTFYDAHLTTGLSEYLVGSLPFFLRWVVRFEGVEGSKEQAVAKLNLVSEKGRYLGPFSRILLALIHLREKRPSESRRLLIQLSREYPENPLIRIELAKITEKLRTGELKDAK